MYDVAADHAAGLIGGLVALPLAICAVRLSDAHRSAPATVQIACVLMAVTGAVHLALVPEHLAGDALTAVLFFLNGVAFIALAAMVRARWWRPATVALIALTVFGYLVYVVFGLEGPDQVGIATKVVELTALGMILVPVRGETAPRDRGWYWALLSVSLPALVILNGTAVWAAALARPDAQHVHAGAVIQATNESPTAEQKAAADKLYTETVTAISPYGDWRNAWAAGYRPEGSETLPSTHWINQLYVERGYVLDPEHPQGLVYANTRHGPVLLGAMFQMQHLGQFGPDPGGPLTAWHEHQDVCFAPLGLEFTLMTPYSICPFGAIDVSAPPMLHVWIVENPKGGRFAVDIDATVVAAIDRT